MVIEGFIRKCSIVYPSVRTFTTSKSYRERIGKAPVIPCGVADVEAPELNPVNNSLNPANFHRTLAEYF